MEALVLRDLDTRHVERPYAKVLEQLRRGDFRSAEAKKLRGSGLYRAKLDDKNRLLFKLGRHAGRAFVLVLEVVRSHDYATARFLNGGTFGEDDFEPAPESTAQGAHAEAEALAYVNPRTPALHFLDKPLSFDDSQLAVFDAPLPLIAVGSAGSGKTALTLEKLKTLPGRGLYLTRSPYLAQNARTLYFASGYANEGQEVDFLSLAELLETIEVPSGREATWGDFSAWYARMRPLFKLKDPHRIYEEIQGVLTGAAEDGPWLTEAQYLDLGVRQSIFLGEERRAVYAVFQRWIAHLRETGLFDANVAAWERRGSAQELYDFLVIDEVQDVTPVELRLALATLREKSQFLLCGDSNQIVHPNLFSWARVKTLFHGDGQASPLERIHVLAANYRNTTAVTDLANRLLLLKQRRFGSIDRESNFLVASVAGEAGHVELVAEAPEVLAEVDRKTRRSTHYAVVVLRDEDKPVARAALQTPLLFSVREAKGLEYEHVVLLNVVSAAAREFRECTAGVDASDLEGGLTYARAPDKTDKSLDAYKFYVNALYVALTRAVKSLLIVEADTAHPLWDLLAVGRTTGQVELGSEESSREEWQREARRLELQGKTEQAEQIRREILETVPVPWPVIDAATFADVRTRAAARDKAAQQLLFEYALTYDAPDLFPELLAAGFRHARNPDSGHAYIASTHYADYAERRPANLLAQLARHGLDFRNPLNETPLMVAARTGRADLVEDLLAQGADPELTDTAGRTPLRIALAAWLDGRGGKRSSFADVYRLLAATPLKVKVGTRMTKLDPSQMEWFLLNLGLVHYRRLIPASSRHKELPAFKATMLERTLASFPERVLPHRRKQRAYVSSILAKNEALGTTPYNRRLFLRVAHGYYVLNPALEIEVKGTWISVADAMGLDLLLESLGPPEHTAYLRRWMESARRSVATHLAAGTDESSGRLKTAERRPTPPVASAASTGPCAPPDPGSPRPG